MYSLAVMLSISIGTTSKNIDKMCAFLLQNSDWRWDKKQVFAGDCLMTAWQVMTAWLAILRTLPFFTSKLVGENARQQRTEEIWCQ